MQTTKILIVEDEALIAEELRDNLEQLGHTVLGIVATMEDAIDSTLRDTPSLILMDIRLRGEGNGIDAARLIQERTELPIIFMTAHSDAETIANAMLTRPYGYVVKPVRQVDLRTAIQTALIRHAAEQRLRACEDQGRAIVENATDLIIQLLPDGRLLSGNPACHKALGYSPSQICRLNLSDLLEEPDEAALAKAILQAHKGESDVELVLTLISKDGRSLPVEGVIGRRLDGGKVDRLWAVFHPEKASGPNNTAGGSYCQPVSTS